MITSLSIKGECQKSKHSKQGANSNSIRATSAGAFSVTAQPPTLSIEELKQEVDDDKIVKCTSQSKKDGEKNPMNNRNKNRTSREYIDDERDVKANDAASNDGEKEEKLGNYS